MLKLQRNAAFEKAISASSQFTVSRLNHWIQWCVVVEVLGLLLYSITIMVYALQRRRSRREGGREEGKKGRT